MPDGENILGLGGFIFFSAVMAVFILGLIANYLYHYFKGDRPW